MTGDGQGAPSTSVGWIALGGLLVLLAAVALLFLRGGEAEQAATDPTPATTPTPPAQTPAVDTAELDRQVRAIAEIVEQLREMSFDRIPEPIFLSEEEIADRVDEILEEYTEEDADLDRRLLAALGAMEPDQDLRELYREALSEQVAGLYDPETEELVVVATPDGEPLGPLAQITLVHELGHALLDQAIGLPAVGEEVPEGEEDAALAAQAVVEGDATLLMLLYAQREMTTEEQFELLEEQQDTATELGALDDLPHFVRRQLMFPYEEGLHFISQVHSAAGWEAVNEAFRDPPATTLDIILPDRYLQGGTTPREVDPVPDPGDGWEHATTRSVGAADIMILFEAPGGDEAQALDDPVGLGSLWRGGEVSLWTSGEESAVALTLVGEAGLCDAVVTWYERAFPDADEEEDTEQEGGGTTFTADRQDAHLRCEGDTVRLGIGPDVPTARTIAG